jgi:hypothetical protein
MIGVGICRVIQWTSSMKCAASWRRQVCECEFLGRVVTRRGPRPGQDDVGHAAVLRAGLGTRLSPFQLHSSSCDGNTSPLCGSV